MGPDLVRGWFLANVPWGTQTADFCFDGSSCVFQPASLTFVVRPSIYGLHLIWRISLLLHTGRLVFWVALWTGAKLVVRVASRRCTWRSHLSLSSSEPGPFSVRTFGNSHRVALCLLADTKSFQWCLGRFTRSLGSLA